MMNKPKCISCGNTKLLFWAKTTDTEYKSTKEIFSFYLCEPCDSLSIFPIPHDQIQEIYPSNYYSYKATSTSLAFRIKTFLDQAAYRKLLKQIPGSELKILDIGGGQGSALSQIRKADSRVAVTQIVDYGETLRSEAEKLGHLYFSSGIQAFETNERYDLIVLLSVIEHVSNPLEILIKCKSMMTENGRILIQTPNFRSLDAHIFKNLNWGGFHSPRHWILFSKESFLKIVSQAELETAEFRYIQGAIFWSWSMMSLLDRWGFIRITKEKPVSEFALTNFFALLFAALEILRLPFFKTSQFQSLLKNPK